MYPHIRWLEEELKKWVGDGLIRSEQADAIRARYPVTPPSLPWGMIIFGGIGAVVVGLGVILLFAYNWAAIPRFGKLAVILGSLIGVHSIALWLFFRHEHWRGLGEALSVLGTMLFGAGICLVAQIYHIEEHYPHAFLVWGLGAIAMAWAYPSTVQAVLASVLFTIWCGSESMDFRSPVHLAPLLQVLLVGPLVFLKKSRFLLSVFIAALTVSLMLGYAGFHCHTGILAFLTLLHLAALLIAAGILFKDHSTMGYFCRTFSFFGWLIFFPIFFGLTFHDLAREILRWEADYQKDEMVMYLLYWFIPMVMALASWSLVFHRHPPGKFREWVQSGLLLIPLSLAMNLIHMQPLRNMVDPWWVAGPANLAYLALTISMMLRGCLQGELRPTVIGSVLLLLLMISRFFDLFEDLLLRGVIFILVGGIIFGQGILYARMRKGLTDKSKGIIAP